MTWQLIIMFLVLQAIIFAGFLAALKIILKSDTDSHLLRLSKERETLQKQQTDLAQKIKEAEEQLAKTKAEADALAKKMMSAAEEKTKAEREEIVQKARAEGEEIITKAQLARDKMKKELEAEMENQAIDHSMLMLSEVLSKKSKGALNAALIAEYIEGLEKIDMSKISPSLDKVTVVTTEQIDDHATSKISAIIKDKLKREMKVESQIDPKITGGIIIKFGSLVLDGSVQNLVKEAGVAHKKGIEEKVA